MPNRHGILWVILLFGALALRGAEEFEKGGSCESVVMPALYRPSDEAVAQSCCKIEKMVRYNGFVRTAFKVGSLAAVAYVGKRFLFSPDAGDVCVAAESGPAQSVQSGAHDAFCRPVRLRLERLKKNAAAWINNVRVPVGKKNEQQLDEKTCRQLKEFLKQSLNKSWWRGAWEAVQVSALGYFATQPLEATYTFLEGSVFFPVTLEWFVEKRLKLNGAGAVDSFDEDSFVAHTNIFDEIGAFIQECTAPTALSFSATDVPTYCVISGINSCMQRLEHVLAFMLYQQKRASFEVSVAMGVTRDALMQQLERFYEKTEVLLHAETASVQERKDQFLREIKEVQRQFKLLVVQRFYRLEGERA